MWTAIRFTLLLFVLGGLCYPAVMTLLAQTIFPHQANGSLVRNTRGQVVGSVLVAQAFTRPEYFHPRPSANNFDGANSGGFNQGQTNQKLYGRVKTAVADYRQINQLSNTTSVPVDAVTASASGLDPHISLANAFAQLPRIAQSRHTTLEQLKKVVVSHKDTGAPGPLGHGAGYVNVLQLNIALDKHFPHP